MEDDLALRTVPDRVRMECQQLCGDDVGTGFAHEVALRGLPGREVGAGLAVVVVIGAAVQVVVRVHLGEDHADRLHADAARMREPT